MPRTAELNQQKYSILGIVPRVDEQIESEFKKLNLEWKTTKESFYIRGNDIALKLDIFQIIQKEFVKDSFANIYFDSKVYLITKKNIYNISNSKELQKAQMDINLKRSGDDFIDLKKLKKQRRILKIDSIRETTFKS